MDRSVFFRELAENEIAKVYLFSGEEEYEKQRALACLKQKALGDGDPLLNDTVLEGADAQSVCEICAQFPMFADRRLVTVRDYPPLLIANAKGGAAETDRMLRYLDEPCDTCVLVFYVHGELPGRDFSRKVRKHPNVKDVVFSHLSDRREIEERLADFLRPYGKRFTRDGVKMLTDMCGTDLSVLSAETEKLAAYTGGRETVTARDVEACASPAASFRVYTIIDRLAEGKGAEAFSGLADALRSGENHVGLLALFERQLANMAEIAKARKAGEGKYDTCARLKISDFLYDTSVGQMNRLRAGAPRELFLEAAKGEYAIKSGEARQDAVLENLMLRVLAARK